jgi:hypothetical protein
VRSAPSSRPPPSAPWSAPSRTCETGQGVRCLRLVAAGGGAVGLILDGVPRYFPWRWTLYVNLAFAAIAIAGALVFIHSSRRAVAACRWKFRFPAQRPHLPGSRKRSRHGDLC